ncbi:MAG: hypothetical protein R3F65_31960 [bacterium]
MTDAARSAPQHVGERRAVGHREHAVEQSVRSVERVRPAVARLRGVHRQSRTRWYDVSVCRPIDPAVRSIISSNHAA